MYILPEWIRSCQQCVLHCLRNREIPHGANNVLNVRIKDRRLFDVRQDFWHVHRLYYWIRACQRDVQHCLWHRILSNCAGDLQHVRVKDNELRQVPQNDRHVHSLQCWLRTLQQRVQGVQREHIQRGWADMRDWPRELQDVVHDREQVQGVQHGLRPAVGRDVQGLRGQHVQ